MSNDNRFTSNGRKPPSGNAVRRGTRDTWAAGIADVVVDVQGIPLTPVTPIPVPRPEREEPKPEKPKPVVIGTAGSLGPLGAEVRAANAELVEPLIPSVVVKDAKATAKFLAAATVAEVKAAIADGDLDLEVVVAVEAEGRKRLGILNLLAPEND